MELILYGTTYYDTPHYLAKVDEIMLNNYLSIYKYPVKNYFDK